MVEAESAALDRLSPEAPLNYLEDDEGNVHIPSSGISVNDEMEAAQKDRFVTEVVPIQTLTGVAQLVTTTTVMGSFEPVRYLVALSPPPRQSSVDESGASSIEASINSGDDSTFVEGRVDTPSATLVQQPTAAKDPLTFVMVDIPPYSNQLATRIRSYLSTYNGRLGMILVTNRDSIHYDEAPAVYSTRRADLDLWLLAFPGLKIIAYRLDIPRDCRHAIGQVLDGYGPFALQEDQEDGDESDTNNSTFSFVESGRPLTYAEWDHDVAQDIMAGKTLPHDVLATNTSNGGDNDEDLYSEAAIRQREEGRRILAVYTPGYSFGSLSYVFPAMGVCCSGFTIPVEDSRFEENEGTGTPGPAIDCRGYMSSSRARTRQMESAKAFVNVYADRFSVVLPSRGDPLFLDETIIERKQALLDVIEQYEKIGEIYERLGIFSDENDDD
jgi:hypothetical protein